MKSAWMWFVPALSLLWLFLVLVLLLSEAVLVLERSRVRNNLIWLL